MPDHADTPADAFAVIVPVKSPSHGKSRLGELPDDRRRELATAFALDTVTAAAATPGVVAVLAVTDDFRFATQLGAVGCEVIPDGVGEDLNATLVQAAAEAERRWPGTRPVAVLADLPCLRPDELEEVLAAVPVDAAGFVRDQAGTGTTVYAAPGAAFSPRFGPDSARRHLQAGAIEVELAAPSVRRDVDDLGDLAAALVLGVGVHTGAVVARA